MLPAFNIVFSLCHPQRADYLSRIAWFKGNQYLFVSETRQACLTAVYHRNPQNIVARKPLDHMKHEFRVLLIHLQTILFQFSVQNTISPASMK